MVAPQAERSRSPVNGYLRLAMSPPILYLVTTKSSAMVCSCSSSDMLEVKFQSLVGPKTSSRSSSPQLGSTATATTASRCPHKPLLLYTRHSHANPPNYRECVGVFPRRYVLPLPSTAPTLNPNTSLYDASLNPILSQTQPVPIT